VIGGMVCETNLSEVLQAVDGQNKLEKAAQPTKVGGQQARKF